MRQVTRLILAAAVAALALAGCDDHPEVNNALTLAYIQHVKAPDAMYVQCTDKTLNERVFLLCGEGYGGTRLANRGLWEAVDGHGRMMFYALNGPAMTALRKIGEGMPADGVEFRAGSERPSVDIPAVLTAME